MHEQIKKGYENYAEWLNDSQHFTRRPGSTLGRLQGQRSKLTKSTELPRAKTLRRCPVCHSVSQSNTCSKCDYVDYAKVERLSNDSPKSDRAFVTVKGKPSKLICDYADIVDELNQDSNLIDLYLVVQYKFVSRFDNKSSAELMSISLAAFKNTVNELYRYTYAALKYKNQKIS